MLDRLLTQAAEFYLANECEKDDTSVVIDASSAFGAVIENPTIGLENMFELYRELADRFPNPGVLVNELGSDDYVGYLKTALWNVGDDHPVIQLVIEQIEATGVDYSAHLAERKHRIERTSVS